MSGLVLFFSDEIDTLCNGFDHLEKLHIDGVVVDAFCRALIEPEIQRELI